MRPLTLRFDPKAMQARQKESASRVHIDADDHIPHLGGWWLGLVLVGWAFVAGLVVGFMVGVAQ